MASRIVGINVVYGVPQVVKPIVGVPDGAKVRLRFRNSGVGKAFVRSGGQTTHYALIDNGETWGLMPQGRNVAAQ